MNICFFHPGAALYGADKILILLVEGVSQAGDTAHVYLPYEGPLSEKLRAIPNVVVKTGPLPVLGRRYLSPLGLLRYGWDLLRSVRWLLRELPRVKPDLVHSNTLYLLPAAIAARMLRIPHLWHVHEIVARSRRMGTLLSWLANRFSTRVIAVSDAVRRQLVRDYPPLASKVTVIRNGIDPRSHHPEVDSHAFRAELGLGPDDVLVGMLGRIHRMKGQDFFLEAIRRLPRRENLTFAMVGGVFAGDEAMLEGLQHKVRAEGLDHVRILDFRTNVAEIHAAFDVFVLPSALPDPFPTVVLEAMATGRPVIATNHGGAAEMVVEGETGFLVDPDDAETLGRRIMTLVDDASLRRRMGSQGRSRLLALFSLGRFVQDYLACCRSLVSGRGEARPVLVSSPSS